MTKLTLGLALTMAITLAACSSSVNTLPTAPGKVQLQSNLRPVCPPAQFPNWTTCFALERMDLGVAVPNGYHGAYPARVPMSISGPSNPMITPKSTSPGLIKPAPMPQTTIQSPNVMAGRSTSPQSVLQALN